MSFSVIGTCQYPQARSRMVMYLASDYRYHHIESRQQVMDELCEMEESGIIEPSHSEWASPIIVVAKKKDGSIRLCVDKLGNSFHICVDGVICHMGLPWLSM